MVGERRSKRMETGWRKDTGVADPRRPGGISKAASYGIGCSRPKAELMRLALANHRKVKKLLKAWEAQTVRLIERNVPE